MRSLGWLLLLLGALPGAEAAPSSAASTWAPRVQRLTVADGLPDQTIYSIAQDRRGFLWFGSTAGAIRYDGRRFRVLRHDPDDPNSLSNDNASQVRIDADDTVWTGHWGGGLHRISAAGRRLEHWRFRADDGNSLASNHVQVIFIDRQNRLWIGTGAGLMGFDARRGRPFRAYTGGEGATALNDYRVWSIAQTADGHLWLGTSGGLIEFDPERGSAQRRPLQGAGIGASELLRLVLVDRKDRIWLAGTSQFGRYQRSNGRFRAVAQPPDMPRLTVNCAVALSERRYWLGTLAGIWMFDSERAEIVPIGGSGQYQWFGADDVRDLYVDRSGMLWAATRFNGVAFAEISAPRFRLYRRELLQSGEEYGSDLVRAIYRDGDTIWLNTDDTMLRADLDRGRFEPLAATRGLRIGRDGPSAFDGRGHAWLATLYGAARIELGSGRLQLQPQLVRTAGLDDANLGAVVRDSRDQLWWTTQREGLLVSDLDGHLLRHIPPGRGRPGDLADLTATCLVEDRRGRIWLCSQTGLSLLEPGQPGFKVFRHVARDPHTLSHSRVISLIEDHGGQIWVGTQAGLDRYDEASGRFQRIPLSPERRTPIESIVQSRPGVLWLATGGQLLEFDSQRQLLEGAPLDSGEAGLAFFERSALRVDERRLLFGSSRGLLLFDANPTPSKRFRPPVALTAAWIDRKPQPLSLTGQLPSRLTLDAEARVLELQFAALDFRAATSNQFAYRLVGFDRDFVDVGNADSATYTNLAPGQYTFVVRAAGADRLWSDDGARIVIEVLPPWWGDRRIQAALTLALAALIALGVGSYLRRQRARERRLERLVAERSQLIAQQQSQLAVQERMASLGTLTAGVAHEINNPTNFAFVGAQNLDVDLAEFHRELIRLAGDDAEAEVLGFLEQRFVRLGDHVATIREGAERIRNIVGQLRSFSRLDEAERKSANIDDGLRTTLALVQTQYRDALRFSTELACTRPIDCWPAQLNQVFMNLIVNACQAIIQRHGRDADLGHLTLRSRDTSDGVVVEFSDNGCGIAAEHLPRIFEPFFTTKSVGEGTGLGLSISYGIVRRHGGRIEVDSTPGQGTSMRVFLPLEAPVGTADGAPAA